jgi:hypothetical protein
LLLLRCQRRALSLLLLLRALSVLLLLRQRWEQRSLHPTTEERYQQQGPPPAELYRQHSSSCGPCFVNIIIIINNIYEVVFKNGFDGYK